MAYTTTDAFSAQFFDDNGAPAENHTLTFLVTGTSTPATIAFDTAGVSTATSVTIGANGFPQNSGSDVLIYFDESVTYDIVRKDSGGTAYGATVTGFSTGAAANAEAALGVLSAAGSTVNAIVADLPTAPSGLNDQIQVVVELQHGANTSSSVSFNLNSLGAKTVKRDNNTALQVGDTAGAGAKLYLSYSAANDVWILLNPSNIKTTVAGDGLANTDGVLSVNVDDSTIETNSDTLRLKDAGITNAKILDGTIQSVKLADSEKVLASGSITAVSEIEFVLSTLDTSQGVYNRYKIYFMNFLPASDDKKFQLTLSSDAGSSYASSNYKTDLFGTKTDSAPTAYIGVMDASGASSNPSNASGEEHNAVITLMNVNTNSSIKPTVLIDSIWYSADSTWNVQNGGATNTTAADYDAVKFTWESGGNFQAVGSYVITKLTKPS